MAHTSSHIFFLNICKNLKGRIRQQLNYDNSWVVFPPLTQILQRYHAEYLLKFNIYNVPNNYVTIHVLYVYIIGNIHILISHTGLK